MRPYLILVMLLAATLNACMVVNESPIQTACELSAGTTDHLARNTLDSLIDKAVEGGLVGGTALLISESKGNYYRAFGLADIPEQSDTRLCQKYRVASLTKVFTAVATLKLIEEGFISLNTLVGDYLSPDQVSGIQGINEITVEQLLNHTSGIPNYDDDERFAPMILNNPGSHITLEEKLNLVRSRPGRVPEWVVRKFGQIYSNTNYLILQLIIEKASGQGYEQYVRAHIIEPLELTNTSFGSEQAFSDGLATGYVDFYGNGVMRNVNDWDAHRFDAEGDLITTATDLAIFYEALLSGRLVSMSMLAEMKKKRLGLLREEFELESALGHDGIAIGYSAEMWYMESSGLMVILLSNQGRLISESWSVLRYENLLRDLIHYGK